MKEESHNPWTDPELEARIVALVLGEASDFERDELNRLIDARPELAAFKEQMQSVHGLLRDAETGESLPDDGDWKLSAEKRSAVLAVIGGEAEKQSAKQTLNARAEKQRPGKGYALRNLFRIAAVVCLVGLPGIIASLALFNNRSFDATKSRMLASSTDYAADVDDASKAVWSDAPASSRDFQPKEGAKGTTAGEAPSIAFSGSTADSELYSKKHSTSALGAIRGTLRFDAATTTDGVTGPESSSQQTAGYPIEWPGEPNGGVDRLTDLKATVQDPASGELSIPSLSKRQSELSTFAAPARSTVPVPETFDLETPAQSTITVRDQGTVLLGGVKRFAADQSGPAVPGEPSASSPMTHDYAELESEGEELGVERERVEALSLDGRPAFGSMSSGFKATDEMSLSELVDAPDDGQDKNIDGFAADGESLGGMGGGMMGGGMGSGGRGMASDRRYVISAETLPQGITPEESGVVRNARESKRTSPFQPMTAGIGGGAESTDAADSFSVELSDTARSANSTRRPTNKPTASTEDLKSNGSITFDERFEEEDTYREKFGNDSAPRPTDDDITLSNGRNLGQENLFRQRSAEAFSGTATTRPRGGRVAEPAKQDNVRGVGQVPEDDFGLLDQDSETNLSLRSPEMEETDEPITNAGIPHGIETRAKSSLGDISAQFERYENIDGAGVLSFDDNSKAIDQLGSSAQPKSKGMQNELLRQFGRPSIAGDRGWYQYVPPMLEASSELMKQAPAKKSAAPAGINEQTAEAESFSTFSLHVSDVSFKLAQAALARGEWPEAAKVRIEEFVNAFDYGDPMPSQSEKVACFLEQSIHPFLQQRNLLRVSMRTAAAGRSSNTPLRLTLLLDNSGSMERIDRQHTVRRAFALLAQQLQPIDQVTLISFARQPRLLADKVSGAQSHQLVQLIHDLPSEGGTNIEAALQLAFEKAQEQQIDGAQNRIILLTDGAVNLGDANPESLTRLITTMRDAGIAFDAAGISAEGLNDDLLEALTRKGDGRYYLLDSLEAADDGFARQIAGAMRPAAKNVKVQIEFNPKRVGRYKLLGFEKHRLNQEDFRNDKVDAAEMAAAEAGVAVYQFEAKPNGEGDVGSVSVRFRDLSTGQMIENRWPIPYEADAPRPDQAAPSLRIAAAAALLAEKIRGEPLGETVDLKTLSDLIAGLPDRVRDSNRVQQLQLMIQQARQMSGK